MRIDKLKTLLAEIEKDPGNSEKLAHLFRNLGDELPRDDFKKLAEIRAELALFDARLEDRVLEPEVEHVRGALSAVLTLLAGYEAAVNTRCCELCETRLLEYVEIEVAAETSPGKAERVRAKLCPSCGADAMHKGGRLAVVGTYRKSPPG